MYKQHLKMKNMVQKMAEMSLEYYIKFERWYYIVQVVQKFRPYWYF